MRRYIPLWVGIAAWVSVSAARAAPPAATAKAPSSPKRKDPRRSAERMIAASRGTLGPVYAPLAE